MSKLDLTNQKFGNLVVLYEDTTRSKITRWICKCSCGTIKSIPTKGLVHDNIRSCGCMKLKNNGLTTRKNAKSNRLYNIWRSIKKRCYLQSNKDYKNYGARGITMCEEWKTSFLPFYEWAMSNGYNDTLSIDRMDYNSGYSPNNCRWVTPSIQQRNKRTNIWIEHNGTKQPLIDWCDQLSVSYPAAKEKCRKLRKKSIPITYDSVFLR